MQDALLVLGLEEALRALAGDLVHRVDEDHLALALLSGFLRLQMTMHDSIGEL